MTRSPLQPAETRRLAMLDRATQMALLQSMTAADLLAYDADFESWRHEGQRPPQSEGWRTWLMMAGRGYGKTRAGAEWITRLATQRGNPVRIALVGATAGEVRSVMIEGESGLLAVSPRSCRPKWEPSLGQLRWPGGSVATVFSAENPDGLRGPSHHFAWCDELGKWSRPDETWDMLQMTLRAGERPRTLVTTTPRSIPLMTRIRAGRWTAETHGKTTDNPHLPTRFLEMMAETYGGTRLGRQELDGELIEDVEGALWSRELIERCRLPLSPAHSREGERGFDRVVIGVDPPASAHGDACGIVAVGLAQGRAHVIEDASVVRPSPEGWARAVCACAARHGADRVVAEANNGGEMVAHVLRAAEAALPVRIVYASRGKSKRAEPVAALYERGKAVHLGAFPALEDELCGMLAAGGYEGPGRSPDRADALVWAMTELMLGRQGEARVRVV